MRILNLVENTEGNGLCGCEHGLSFYIETQKHKLLMDTGASDLLLRNAQALGVDLTAVDTVILSHGHYDHGGGIMPLATINSDAHIYLQQSAFEDYCSLRGDDKTRYIGIAPEIRSLGQVVLVGAAAEAAAAAPAGDAGSAGASAGSAGASAGGAEVLAGNAAAASEPPAEDPGILEIDDELTLFWNIGNSHPIPDGNNRLKIRTPAGLLQDDFRHEQCLVIRQAGRSILLSGCAHHGILNILERYRELFGADPDVVISGFHMMRRHGYSENDINTIVNTALALKKYRTQFYTCHCTGTAPYEAMHKILGDQLLYVHCGEEITPPALEEALKQAEEPAATAAGKTNKKKGNNYMKCHKFFAWATAACFLLTVITGYKRK